MSSYGMGPRGGSNTSAQDFTQKIKDLLSEVGIPNLTQTSMDRQIVNWRVFEILYKPLQKDAGKSLINTSLCGLHIVNNMFKVGSNSTRWVEVENGLNWLFHDCPAHHKDFMTATDGRTSTLKFCKHQWIENLGQKAGLLLWLQVKHYIKMVGKGERPAPKVKSF